MLFQHLYILLTRIVLYMSGIEIKLSQAEISIAGSACDMVCDGWEDSHDEEDSELPEEWPEVNGMVLNIPQNKDVIDDLVVRVNDEIDFINDYLDDQQHSILVKLPNDNTEKSRRIAEEEARIEQENEISKSKLERAAGKSLLRKIKKAIGDIK